MIFEIRRRESRLHTFLAKLMFDDCLALSGVVLRHGLGRSGLVSFSRVSSLRTVFVVFAVLVILVGASMATTPIPISSPETPSTAMSAPQYLLLQVHHIHYLDHRDVPRKVRRGITFSMMSSPTKASAKWSNLIRSLYVERA